MKQNIDIEELITAAQRVEADKRRKQQLSEMIDRMAAEEAISTKRKRVVWLRAGAAASILLLGSLGLHLLRQDAASPSQQPMIAESKPRSRAIVDTIARGVETETDAVMTERQPHTSSGLALSETDAEISPIESQQNESNGDETIIEVPVVMPEEPLLAEKTENGERRTENGERKTESTLASSQIASRSSHIYERTSTRLVCGSGCRPEVRPSQENTSSFAFTNISSTGTTIGLGGGAF